MDDTQEQENPKHKELDEIMARIEKYCDPDNPPEDGVGVAFHKGLEGDLRIDTQEKKIRRDANSVFDGMMLTLQNIAVSALEKAKKKTSGADMYETVLRAIEPMIQIGVALADGNYLYKEISVMSRN